MLWTLPRQLFAGFGSLFAVVLVLLGGFEYVLRTFKSEVDVITRDNIPGLMLSAEALQHALEYRVLTLRHLLSENSEEWKTISEACDALATKTVNNLASYQKTITTEEDRALFAKVAPVLESYRATARRMRELNTAGDHAGALALVPEAGAAFTAYEKAVLELTNFNRKFAQANAEAFVGTMQEAHVIEAILGGTAVVVALGAGFFISRRITRSISGVAGALAEGSSQIASASAQMSGASQTLAEGSSEQAASLEEASASL
ncbi:MAG TPA: MCP four helix bundle domain-containing protein, partial [Opitutaceae bacterium]